MASDSQWEVHQAIYAALRATATGFAAFGAAAGIDEGGTHWADETNALIDDTVPAFFFIPSSGPIDKIRFTNPSLAAPARATVVGVEIRIRRFVQSLGTAQDNEVFLYDDGRVGDNQAKADAYPNTAAVATYGGATDLMGATLTPDAVNGATFGFELRIDGTRLIGFVKAFVEYVEINVHYTTALSLLTGDPPRVFDHVPQDTDYPYVVIGDARGGAFDTKDTDGEDQTVFVHVFSQYRGQSEAKQIAAAIIDALDQTALAVSGFALVLLRFLSGTTVLLPDGLTRHATLQFRAITQPE